MDFSKIPGLKQLAEKLDMEPKKALLLVGGAVGVCALASYLSNKPASPSVSSRSVDILSADSSTKAGELSKDQILQILKEMVKVQDEMRVHTKQLIKEVRSGSLTLEQTCRKVQAIQLMSPLDKLSLSLTDFNGILEKYQEDATVQSAVVQAMSAPTPGSGATEKASSLTVQKLTEVHAFMLAELEKMAQAKGRSGHDAKTVTFAAQAILGAKVEDKFGFVPEDVENAVIMKQTSLATNTQFATLNAKLQGAMAQLMGS